MKTLAFDINVFESKEQRVSLKALGMFYRPSIKAWVKRIYIKNQPENEVQKQVTEFSARIKAEFKTCPITVTHYTEADALKRAQYRADAGPVKVKAVKTINAPTTSGDAELKQLLALLIQKLA
jgi:hypothetical protein